MTTTTEQTTWDLEEFDPAFEAPAGGVHDCTGEAEEEGTNVAQ